MIVICPLKATGDVVYRDGEVVESDDMCIAARCAWWYTDEYVTCCVIHKIAMALKDSAKAQNIR